MANSPAVQGEMKKNSSRTPQTIAAVDLGSNSFHLIVARLHNGEVRVLDRLREMVRLGGGLDSKRHISPEVQRRALECLTRFGERLAGLPSEAVRVVGTNTLRSARNAEPLIEAMEAKLGHPIEIISGMEEARLIYLGVAHSLAADGRRRLVMDIGGGSTELIIGKGFEPICMQSIYLGCVSLTRTRFRDGRITRKAVKRALLDVRMELEPVVGKFRRHGWERPIGASGTIRAVDKVIRAAGWERDGITLRALQRLKEALLDAGDIGNLSRLPGLSQERAPVFPGGVMVLLGTFEALGIERMEVSDGALREGLLYELVGRIREEDIRSRSIDELVQRYRLDREHATQVRKEVLGLLSQVASSWGLEGKIWRQLLGWAAQIHEIGLSIAHGQHHKHGAYIAEYSDLAGFSRREQKLLATLIRAHRRKFPIASFQELPKSDRLPAKRLAILLRLAVLLHRSRSGETVPQLKLKAKGGCLRLRLSPDWLEQHPLTCSDLEQEADYLAAADVRLTGNYADIRAAE